MNSTASNRIDYGDMIIGVLFTVVGFVAGCLFYLVTTFVRGSYRAAVKTVEKAKATGEGESRLQVENEVTAVNAPALDESLWKVEEVVAATLRRVELKGGYVSCRFYQNTGVVVAKLQVTSRALQKRLGKTVRLEDRSFISVPEALSEIKADAERMLADKPIGSTEVGTPVPVAKPIAKETEPEVIEQVPAVRPKVAKVEMPKPSASNHERGEVSYQGTILSFGIEERKKGTEKFDQFCVRLHDEDLQAENPLWGVDLERVIQETGAKVGDRVKLSLVGETQVLVKDKKRPKKLWALTKI